MSFKDVTCMLCKMILDEPISLPCGCIICNEHLTDNAFIFNNQIKCISCDRQHEVLRDGFRTSKTAKKLIEQELYLSEEDKQLKKQIQIQYDEFMLKFDTRVNEYEATSREHFAKLRENIEIQRDKLKKRIEDISAELIQMLWDREDNTLKEIYKTYSQLIEKSQLEINYRNIFKEFRHVSLNHVTLNELKLRQDLIYSSVNTKVDDSKYWLNEVNKIEFKPSNATIDLGE